MIDLFAEEEIDLFAEAAQIEQAEIDDLFAEEIAQIDCDAYVEHEMWISNVDSIAFGQCLSAYVPDVMETYAELLEVQAFDQRLQTFEKHVTACIKENRQSDIFT